MKLIALLAIIAVARCAPSGAPNGLYALDGNYNLVRVNPTTAATTIVGNIQRELQAEQVSAIDNVRGLMFLMGQNTTTSDVNLIAVNLTNARVELEVNLPFMAEGLVGVGTSVSIDEMNGVAYVLGPVSQTQWNVVSVNIATQAMDVVYSFVRNDIPVIGVSTIYCPNQEFLWVPFGLQAGGIDLYAVDTRTKSVVRYLPAQDNAGPLSYNKKTGNINGLGVSISQNGSSNSFERFLVTIDCTTGVATRGKNVTNQYVIVNDDLFAINYLSQTGYAYLATFVNGKLGRMRLVGVDLKLGKVLVNPPPVTQDQIWSLHYYTAGKSGSQQQ